MRNIDGVYDIDLDFIFRVREPRCLGHNADISLF